MIDAYAPPQHLPWRPLRLEDPVGGATRAKLLAVAPEACRRILSEGGVAFRRLPDRDGGGFCQVRDAIAITGGLPAFSPAGPPMACRQALAFALWSRHEAEPAARRLLGSPIASYEHYGSYACRRVYGQATGSPSQHATANAIDIAAIRLADGRRLSVLTDFRREDRRGSFLHRARDGACRVFSHTLSPDYNAAHRDHFHLDMGGWSVCR